MPLFMQVQKETKKLSLEVSLELKLKKINERDECERCTVMEQVRSNVYWYNCCLHYSGG